MQKSFKIQLLLFALMASFASFGQNLTKTAVLRGDKVYIKESKSIPASCYSGIHPIFGKSSKKPIKLNFLGSSKQFAELGKNVGETPSEIYANLQKIYSTRKPHAKELDRLLKAMGYTGFKDPSFTPDKINSKVEVPAGTVGMIGNAKNTYQWVQFEKSFYGFEIIPLNGCGIFIMQNCGNAFHSAEANQTVVNEYAYDSNNPNNISGYKPKADCVNQTLNGSANASQAIDGAFNGTQEIRILARNQGDKDKGAVLCIGKATIPFNASYSVMVDGNAVASQTIKACADNTTQIIPITLTLKKGMVKDNKVTFGADGRAYIDVNQKQFNALGKVFEKCCPNDCAPAK